MTEANAPAYPVTEPVEAGTLPEGYLELIRKIQKEYPNTMLTGTCALVIYGFDIKRSPTDIDFILPDLPEPLPASWVKIPLPESFQAACYETMEHGIKVQFIIWDEWEPEEIWGIRCTRIHNLLEAKKDLGMSGTLKHLEDFYNITCQLLALCTLNAELSKP